MSGLLYLVASRIDGSRTPEAIAESVSGDLGRSLSPDQVRYLITGKLIPLGVVTSHAGPAALPKANPLLALRARATLLPERVANAVGLVLRPTVPMARRGGGLRQRCVLGLLAVRSSRACRGARAGAARPGGPPHRGRPVRDLGRVSRMRARSGLPLRRRKAWQDRGGHLPGVAVLLHQRHGLLPRRSDLERRSALEPRGRAPWRAPARCPQTGNRLGSLCHPAAHAHRWVLPDAASRDHPCTVAFCAPGSSPRGHSSRRSPLQCRSR
jgi:hypothetical protein